jgi:predicted dehydrogenase
MENTELKNLQEQPNRRDFVKTTTLVGSGLMMGLTLPFTAQGKAWGDETLKVALIGCGGRGTGAAAQALSTPGKVELVAMVDAFQDRLDQCYNVLSQKFNGQNKVNVKPEHKFVGFDGYKEAIALADVVILTTPPGFRPMHFEECVKAGKHVFMEKPVATDAPGIRRVLAAAEIAKQKKLNVVVGLQRHYQTNYRELIKRIKKGAIGQIVSGQVYWNNDGVWVNPRQAGQTEMEYQMRNWYYFNWLCGDHICEQHIHNIDVANWFIGEYPASAQGMGGREIRKGKDFGEIFDHHFVEFTYPSGAVIASQCRHQPQTMSRVSESFQGTKGKVDTSNSTISDYKGKVIFQHQGPNDPDPYQVEHDELFAAIRTGKVINDAENGAKSTLSAIMGRMATYSGQVITWQEALNSEVNLMPPVLSFDAKPLILPDENGFYPIAIPGKTKVL